MGGITVSTRYNLTPAAVKEQLKIIKEQAALKADKSATYTKTEVDTALGELSDRINAAQTAAYKPAGSVTFAQLPAASEATLGNVYDVTDAFTTTDAFIEGAGKQYPGGTEVGVVLRDGAYKFNIFSGFVNYSAFARNSDFTEITAADIRGYWNE